MASRKWWSKRKWPVAPKSETSSVSSRVSKSSKRGRSSTGGLFVSSQRSTSLRRSQSATPSQIASRSYRLGSTGPTQSRAPEPSLPRPLATPAVPLRSGVDQAFEEFEDDSLNEIILALDIKGQVGRGSACQVGACYYVARDEKLYFLPDSQSQGLEIIEAIRLHAQPTTILLPSRVDEEVDQTLDPRDNEDSPLPYVLDIRPSPEFEYASGKRKLTELRIPSQASMRLIVPGHEDPYESYLQGLDHGFTGRQGKLLEISTMVDLESMLSIGCANALLSCLQRRREMMHLPGDLEGERFLRVSFVETTTLKGFMHVTTDLLSALQIVQSQSDPGANIPGPHNSGSKDGLSVLGLFRPHAKTPQGRSLLRQYFLRPSLDLEVIHERHATISSFLASSNEGKMDELSSHLKSIKDMRIAMMHLHKGKSGGIKNGVWTVLRSFTYYALYIRKACSEVLDSERRPIVAKVLEGFPAHELATVGRLVVDLVDFKQSAEKQRTVVNAGVDEELDELKRTYDGLEDLLSEMSRVIAATVPQQFAIELAVVFLPQIGFLICMPRDPGTGRSRWEGGPGQEAWERIFATEEHVYYKDFRMQELDERIGDLHAAICDKEIELVHELAQRVLEYEDILCRVSEICGELDALLALAQAARLHKLHRPRMTPANVIEVHEGRHLLQEQTVPNCIPNDTLLIGGEGADCGHPPPPSRPEYGDMPPPPRPSAPSDGPSMLVLTGPNYSGKSIYLKQVALIVYLAHVGSFVPASRATIGLTDRILTRIATRESVARPQSAFAIDLQQVCTALHSATRQSLVLLDEFGKGTAVCDGAGLLCGTLEHLLGRPRCEQAKVLVATHFHELFEDRCIEDGTPGSGDGSASPSHLTLGSFLPPRPGLAFGTMKVQINKTAFEATDQVTYLYKLQPGRSLASLGMVCAALNGIDAEVVERAEELATIEANGGDLVAACAGTGETAEELEELEQAEAVAQAFLSVNLDAEMERNYSGQGPWRALLEELV